MKNIMNSKLLFFAEYDKGFLLPNASVRSGTIHVNIIRMYACYIITQI